MKPIIGIILRPDKSDSNLDIGYVYTDIILAVKKSGGIPIGVDTSLISDATHICNGFIIPGGDNILDDDLKAIKEITSKDIPLLGICLGMQEIGYLNSGTVGDILNHKIDGLHEIIIKPGSLLHKIIGCEKTSVNSRHNSSILATKLTVSAISHDNIIEAIEDKNKQFLLGIEWHPENMYETDLNSRKIFDYFIKVCHDNDS